MTQTVEHDIITNFEFMMISISQGYLYIELTLSCCSLLNEKKPLAICVTLMSGYLGLHTRPNTKQKDVCVGQEICVKRLIVTKMLSKPNSGEICLKLNFVMENQLTRGMRKCHIE